MTEIKKQYYTVKVEANVPVLLKYKVLAESPEEALKLSLKLHPTQNLLDPPTFYWNRIKKIKSTVYILYSSVIKLVKNL